MTPNKSWWLYLIECRDGGIYTGIALDVEQRYKKHAAGRGAKYTRMNPPLKLLGKAQFPDKSSALKAEYAMKQLGPEMKRQWASTCGAPPAP